jgi:hypothetical protein
VLHPVCGASRHVLDQTGHHQVICEEYTNDVFLSHSLTSAYNANIGLYFKCHLQSHLKFVKKVIKITFSVYLSQHVSASQDHHHATVNRSESLHCMGSHVNIFTCYYCMSSYSRMYARTFLMLFPCCGVHAVFFVRSFPRSGVYPSHSNCAL